MLGSIAAGSLTVPDGLCGFVMMQASGRCRLQRRDKRDAKAAGERGGKVGWLSGREFIGVGAGRRRERDGSGGFGGQDRDADHLAIFRPAFRARIANTAGTRRRENQRADENDEIRMTKSATIPHIFSETLSFVLRH